MGNQKSQFEALIVPHASSLLRFARRLCGSATLAEDLVQEALLRGWRGARRLPETSNPRAWIFRILLNTWYSEGRRRGARPVELPMTEASATDHVKMSHTGPTEATEISQALSRLPEDHRSVLLLAVVEGFTCQEIADMLAIPIGTVMSRLSRARAAMRSMMSGEVPGELRKAGVGSQ